MSINVGQVASASTATNWYQKLRVLQNQVGQTQTQTPSNITAKGTFLPEDVNLLIAKLPDLSYPAGKSDNRVYYSYADSYTIPDKVSVGQAIAQSVANNLETAITNLSAVRISNNIHTQGVTNSNSTYNSRSWTCSGNNNNWPSNERAGDYNCYELKNWYYSESTGDSYSRHSVTLYYRGYYVKSASSSIGDCSNTCQKKL